MQAPDASLQQYVGLGQVYYIIQIKIRTIFSESFRMQLPNAGLIIIPQTIIRIILWLRDASTRCSTMLVKINIIIRLLYCDSGMQAPDAAFSTHADPSFAARDQHWPTTNHTYNIIQTTNAIVLLL